MNGLTVFITRFFIRESPSLFAVQVLWLGGVLCSAGIIVSRLPETINSELAGSLAVVLLLCVLIQLLFGILHQCLVFHCVHSFENPKQMADWQKMFPGWIYSRKEYWVRIAIVFLLLVIGGEIPAFVKELAERSTHVHKEIPLWVFPSFSVVLYATLLFWDVKAKALKNKISDLDISAIQFFWSDLLALVFWGGITLLLVISRATTFKGILILLSVISMTFYILVIAKRLSRYGGGVLDRPRPNDAAMEQSVGQ